jgi:hypothetical protein
MRSIRSLVTFAASCAILLGACRSLCRGGGGDPPPAEPTASGGTFTPDLFCGPRCVRYLLARYGGTPPPLPSIVRAIQWPDVEAGTSLTGIQRILEDHRVWTRAVRVPDSHVLVSDHPCVVHLRSPSPSALGHYVVLLPGATRWRVTVYDGGDLVELPAWELATRASGVAVMTAPLGSEPPVAAAVMTGDAVLFRCGCLIACLLGANALGSRLYRRIKEGRDLTLSSPGGVEPAGGTEDVNHPRRPEARAGDGVEHGRTTA